ncbi:MAG TPA: hypothetical protein VFR10_13895, partial [bacterium]|nr:hypothetical protein [bacterium]
MSEQPARRRSSGFVNLLVVLVALLLPLIALEVYLRVRGADTRSWTMPNSVIGWSYVPGAHYEHVSAEQCPGWRTSGRINSKGLRDRNFDYEKPPGTFRILALGDSFTEAFQFDVEKTWTKLLEAQLNRDGIHAEVINCGRSGMGTTTEWLFFQNEGKKYEPDLVLLLFIPNDFQDNSKRVALATAYGPYLKPAGDAYVLDTSFLQSRDYRMRKWMTSLKRVSYVVSAGMDRYASMRASRAAKNAGHAGDAPVNIAAREGLGPSWTEEDFLWVQNPSEEWIEAARITQEALRRLHRAVADDGAIFAVVNGTTRIQVHPDEIVRVAAEHPNWNLDGPQRFLLESAAIE